MRLLRVHSIAVFDRMPIIPPGPYFYFVFSLSLKLAISSLQRGPNYHSDRRCLCAGG